VSLDAPEKAQMINVVSAQSMEQAMTHHAKNADIIISCAAVADYTPANVSDTKIKKNDDMSLRLIRTKDILKILGEAKTENQILVGFAAETNDFDKYAKAKLESKNLDIIALNDVSRPGEGFGADTNNIKLFFKDNSEADLGVDSKEILAKSIINSIFEYRLKTTR